MSARRFVVFAQWPDGSVEELDVDAAQGESPRKLGEQMLREGYEPGWSIVKVEGPMQGMYL